MKLLSGEEIVFKHLEPSVDLKMSDEDINQKLKNLLQNQTTQCL